MTYPNVVVKIGKMASTNVDSFLQAVQNTVDMGNGSHVIVGAPIAGCPEILACTTATDVTKQEVLIVESPVIVEINGLRVDLQDPQQFYVPAGRPARARILRYGDKLTITANGFASLPTVGQFAVPVNGSYLLAPATTLAGATLVAYTVVAAVNVFVGKSMVAAYQLQVVSAL
jgi:hypothetical protein